MKHYIIVKFDKSFDYKSNIGDITGLFKQTLDIKGINAVSVKPSNSERENRYDLMIEIDMEKPALCVYDNCTAHQIWKEKYGKYIDKKAIFDCER